MNRAARAVTARLRQVKRFRRHPALQTRHHRVPVQAAPGPGITAAVLAGSHTALDHRVDDFQVRGVERQRQVDGAAARGDIAGEAFVVLDVAVGEVSACLPSNSAKVARHLAHDVHEHVQAATMGHAPVS